MRNKRVKTFAEETANQTNPDYITLPLFVEYHFPSGMRQRKTLMWDSQSNRSVSQMATARGLHLGSKEAAGDRNVWIRQGCDSRERVGGGINNG
ncbi:hypothetical protein AAFF_G00377840 [Aldrovandia affinis]|uniref:Uncharacterized protein n=1 Tax=Aldrovandia affinis TaxID=143900 RepID=A0AAD7SG25_9TELE|nr:hypothetical protein AAFF_G00377840 [Aldrovandia affinis]